MATRVLAQVLVAGATVLVRAATQAWHQALANAQRTGVAQEAVNKATSKVTSSLSLQEAQMILGVESGQTWEQVMKRYKHLFDANEKHGSFYLVSKVYRAKERLEEEYRELGIKTDDPPTGPSAGEQQQQQGSRSDRQQQDGR